MASPAVNQEPESLSPAAVDSEQVVLGCILEDGSLLPSVLGSGLVEADLSLEDHRRLFAAILRLHENHSPIDCVSVLHQLGGRGDNAVLVASCITGVVVVRSHVQFHCQIVRKKARLRELQSVGNWLVSAAAEPGADPEQLAEAACERLGAVGVSL